MREFGEMMELAPEEAPLSQYLRIIHRHLGPMLGFVAASAIVARIISPHLTPLYESTATVDVDRQMPTQILGQVAHGRLNDADQFLATQVKLIQSDAVLRPVIEQFHLPETFAEGAARLPELRVTRPPNTYLLSIRDRAPNAGLAADVSNAVARSYVEQTYNIRARSSAALAAIMKKQTEELKRKMDRSSGVLAGFDRELNVVDPHERTSMLAARLLQLNTEYTSAQTERVRKEGSWQAVKSGTIEAAEVSPQGEALKKLQEELDEARQKFVGIKTHFGANHPEFRKDAAQVEELESQLKQARENTARLMEVQYREALQREEMLQKAVAETKAESDRINARFSQYQVLKSDADADRKLYEDLERKIAEAGINAGFENSAIRIADEARPAQRPVSQIPS
jgi:polysaccharide biosynthesis transport protein